MPASGSYDQEVRWNPILRKFVPSHITAEEHTIGPLDGLPGVYGIKLIEFPLNTTDPSTATISDPPISISGYVMTSSTPGPGEFYPDFYETDGAVPHRSSYLIFDSSEDGETVTVDYWGGGGAGTLVNFRSLVELGFPVLTREVFTSSGTWTKPANIVPNSIVRMRSTGGGGGGGGQDSGAPGLYGGGGGGGGGIADTVKSEADLGATETVTIGAAGTAGGSSADGGDGGTTSIGTHCVAAGGKGGKRGLNFAGGRGGVGTTGDVLTSLGPGGPGIFTPIALSTQGSGGQGGGPGGQGAYYDGSTHNGENAPGYGGGGGGGMDSGTAGTGKAGLAEIEYWVKAG